MDLQKSAAQGQVALDVDDSWVASMENRLKAVERKHCCRNKPPTIHRVPEHISRDNQKAYQPKIVSIGPYHHGVGRLQAMDQHKWRYLQAILSRNQERKLKDYLKEIRSIQAEALGCYSESVPFGSRELVEMIVLDGCFIIELFLMQKEDHVPDDDPIYSTSWVLSLVGQDMLLLENQLPFMVLQRLFDLVSPGTGTSLAELALDFFSHLLPAGNVNPHVSRAKPVYHLLHLFHSCLLPTREALSGQPPLHRVGRFRTILYAAIPDSRKRPPYPPKTIPTATRLQEAGIKFRSREAERSFVDVNFHKGVMEIPRLSIYHSTDSLLRNLIALEQCVPYCKSHFTSYAFFMDCLVNTPRDVAILNQHNIIEHVLGCDEDVALLFNQLCEGVAINFDKSYLSHLFVDVRKYCERDWNMWRAMLVRDYFGNPWVVISLVAAIFILLAAFVQTLFSVLSYVRDQEAPASVAHKS